MLGKIFEEQGDKAKALEHYEKFLSLWKDADPGIAELEYTSEKLAGLSLSPDTAISTQFGNFCVLIVKGQD
jgi:hypothetical protein